MLRRALLLALAPALILTFGCGKDENNPVKPGVTTTLISNLSTNDSSSISLDSGRVAAVGFTMPDSAYKLAVTRLKLRIGAGASDSIVVRLFGNTNGNPGVQILTFTGPILPVETGQPSVTTFTPQVSYTLAADSTYWLVVYNAGSGSVRWTTGPTPTGVAHFAGARADSLTAPSPPMTSVNTIGQFDVIGTRTTVTP